MKNSSLLDLWSSCIQEPLQQHYVFLIRCVWYDIMNVTLQCNWQDFNSQAWGHISLFIVLEADVMHWAANGEALDLFPQRSQTKSEKLVT